MDLMMETNFTRFGSIVRLLTVILFSFFSVANVDAQACACNTSIDVTLDQNGSVTVTPAMLLTDAATCAGTQTVTIMLTPNGNPIPGSPVLNCSYAGKTVYGKVSNGTNSCWTTILVEDKIKPVITCPAAPMTMTCVELDNFVPAVSDNCGIPKLNLVGNDIITNNSCNAGLAPNVLKRITRTYQAEDASGNLSLPCTFTIDVTVIPTLDATTITFPLNYDVAAGNNDALVCDGSWAKIDNTKIPSPVDKDGLPGTGAPKIGTVELYQNPELYCGLNVTLSDAPAIKINCVTKIIRTWQVIEWSCLNRPPLVRVQMLEIVDNVGPAISGLTNLSGTTGNHACTSNVTFPAAIVSDNCSEITSITVDITIYPNGGVAPGVFIKHGSPKVATLPVGSHVAVYTAYDACYNSTTASINIEVEDNTPPVAICDENTTVGLTSDGTAWVPAVVFDDGSYDECSLGKVLVRRMDTDNCGLCPTPSFPGFKYLGVYGTGVNTKYYYLSNHKATPKVAHKTAKAMGGYGVSYETPEERSAVRSLVAAVNDTLDFLVGYTDTKVEGTYVWESGATNVMAVTGNTNLKQYVVVQRDAMLGVNDGRLLAVTGANQYQYVVEISNPCGWSEYAQFCCTDVAANQMVAFRAIDASGNFNDCMVTAVIQDKIGPTITCPDSRTVTCDQSYDPTNLRKDFGWPTASDNCINPTITRIDSTIAINSCRVGTITRRFMVTDAGGRTATCTQVITFEPSNAQVYNGPSPAQWPRDTMISGCGNPNAPGFLPAVLGNPILTDGACSLVGAEYDDQTFSFNNPTSPACFKILRKWTVIDWCQPLVGGGYRTWTHLQEIKVIDNIAPVIAQLAPMVTANTFDAACANGEITLTASATDVCTAVLRSSYAVDAFNNGSIDITSTPVNSNSINATDSYPVGTHRIIYTFEDKCGNVTSREQLFSIVNRKAPSITVLNGLAMSLMQLPDGSGMADIWATDFNLKAEHPCGYDLLLSFTEVQKDALGNLVGTPNLVFNCNDLDTNYVTIYAAALTPAGDIVQTFVETYIIIQDNNNICDNVGGRSSVKGTLATETNEKVQDVRVSLYGSEMNVMTGSNGAFDFANMNNGGNYTVSPNKNDDHTNGVTTLDLVLMQRHILAIDKLNSPYKLIAADVTKDGKITAADLVELRKLILGTKSTFENNTSWRFVDKAYVFHNTAQAQADAFPEVYNIENLTSDMVTDFVAIKVGDVNGNAKANNFNTNTDARSNQKLVLTSDVVDFTAGQQFEAPIKVAQNTGFSGVQFTMTFDADKLTLVGINGESLDVVDQNFGYTNVNDGIVTLSWNDVNAKSLNAGETLFNLTFEAKANGSTADIIAVTSDITKAEAYTVDADIMKVEWMTGSRTSNENFVLQQNTPNPFKANTVIGFELPSDMAASITVYDVTGKVINSTNVQGLKGLNTFTLDQNSLPAGVLYYSLKAGSFQATKKMVVIE